MRKWHRKTLEMASSSQTSLSGLMMAQAGLLDLQWQDSSSNSKK
jgi:hypothetical protein